MCHPFRCLTIGPYALSYGGVFVSLYLIFLVEVVRALIELGSWLQFLLLSDYNFCRRNVAGSYSRTYYNDAAAKLYLKLPPLSLDLSHQQYSC